MQLLMLRLERSCGFISVSLVVQWTGFLMSDLNLRVSVLRGVSESMDRLLVFTNPLVSCNRSLVYRRLIGGMFASK